MSRVLQRIRQKGQGLVEYALVLLLVAIVVIFLLTFVGMKIKDSFSKIGSGLGS